jgi:nicotinamidase-related amidase
VSVFDRSSTRQSLAIDARRGMMRYHRQESLMKTALIVIDVQESFRQRPYWDVADVPQFIEQLQRLIERCEMASVPVLQVFHVEDEAGATNPFSSASGFVRTLSELRIVPEAVFRKSVHSAMFASNASGQSVDYWLRSHGIQRLIVTGIRTEQCCETTTRHASDLGYTVTYATDATLTFAMTSAAGRDFSSAQIKERTELVLAGRFADVRVAAAVEL